MGFDEDDVVRSANIQETHGDMKKGALLEIDATRDITNAEHDLGFNVTKDQVHVLAIAHDRRRPVYWSGRADI